MFELEKHLSLSFQNLKSYVQLANLNQIRNKLDLYIFYQTKLNIMKYTHIKLLYCIAKKAKYEFIGFV